MEYFDYNEKHKRKTPGFIQTVFCVWDAEGFNTAIAIFSVSHYFFFCIEESVQRESNGV